MNVFLAGEGRTELGDWANELGHRSDPPERGVLEALLRRVSPEGWTVGGARRWSRIVKYRAGDHASAEARTIRGLALHASEHGAGALVFVRDRDGDGRRAVDFADGIARATAEHPELTLVGELACEEVEAWILAIRGELRSETHRHPKEVLAERGIRTTAEKVTCIEAANLAAVPADATSLCSWLEQARVRFVPATGES